MQFLANKARIRAERWLKGASGAIVVTRDQAMGVEVMAYDVLDAVDRIAELERQLSDVPHQLAAIERDTYRAMLCDLLASAHPHPVDHPTMAKQWARARDLLKNGPEELRKVGAR